MPVSGPFCPYCGKASKLAASDPNFDIHEHVKGCGHEAIERINRDLLGKFHAQPRKSIRADEGGEMKRLPLAAWLYFAWIALAFGAAIHFMGTK